MTNPPNPRLQNEANDAHVPETAPGNGSHESYTTNTGGSGEPERRPEQPAGAEPGSESSNELVSERRTGWRPWADLGPRTGWRIGDGAAQRTGWHPWSGSGAGDQGPSRASRRSDSERQTGAHIGTANRRRGCRRVGTRIGSGVRRRYLVVCLTLSGAGRGCVELVCRVAIAVRMRVRLVVYSVRYAVLVSAVAPPSLSTLAQFFMPKLRSTTPQGHVQIGRAGDGPAVARIAGTRPAGDGRAGARPAGPGQHEPVTEAGAAPGSRADSQRKSQPRPPVAKLPRAGGVVFLVDPRVRSLQRTIVDSILSLRFGVRATGDELAVLSRFSSAAWLAFNLEVAAGIHGMRLTAGERQHRVLVVYPVFFKLMRLHLGLSRSGAQTTMPRARRLWLRLRHRGPSSSVGSNGEILHSLYPQEITIEQLRARLGIAERHARRRYRAVRNREDLERCALYLRSVTLATSPRRARAWTPQSAAPIRPRSSARIACAVNRVTAEFYRQDTNTH